MEAEEERQFQAAIAASLREEDERLGKQARTTDEAIPAADGGDGSTVGANVNHLAKWPADVLQEMIGLVDGDQFIKNQFTLKELANLTRTSQTMHDLVQPILDMANAWRKSKVIERIISETLTDQDKEMLKLFGHNPSSHLFRLAYNVVQDKRLPIDMNEYTLKSDRENGGTIPSEMQQKIDALKEAKKITHEQSPVLIHTLIPARTTVRGYLETAHKQADEAERAKEAKHLGGGDK